MTVSLPRLQQAANLVDQSGVPSTSFHIWWDQFASQLETVLTQQADAIAILQAMNDPDTLTPVEKPMWMFMYSSITSEQSDIDAKATSYGITTEKTNYDNAITTLTNYLVTLTTPVDWDDTSGDTAINGVTFINDFNDVLLKRTLLLNKMQATAKTLADTAQTSANTAQTTADGVKKTDKISGSWTSPGNVLSATDAGSNASVIVASHTRRWGDSTTTSVSGHTFTGKSYSTDYYVYYDDPNQNDTSPSYQITTSASTAAHNRSSGRVFVGAITTPAAAAPDTDGGTTLPGGGNVPPQRID